MNRIHFKHPHIFTQLLLIFAVISISHKINGLEYPIEFEQMPLEPGAVSANIFSIAQDSTGFIWVSTPDALYKYDGYQFVKYSLRKYKEHHIIPRTIVVDPANNIWIKVHEKKIAIYNPQTDTLQKVIDSPEAFNGSIKNFIFVNDTIWLDTDLDGLFMYIPESRQLIQILDRDRFKHELRMMYRVHRDLWISTDINGIYKYNLDSGRLRLYYLKNFPSDSSFSNVRSIYKDQSNTIWIGTHFGTIFKYNEKLDRFEHFFTLPEIEHRETISQVLSITSQDTNRIWLGTSKLGLGCLNLSTKKFTCSILSPDKISGIQTEHILRTFVDNNGVIWLGTSRTGLYKQKGRPKFSHHLLTATDDSTKIDNYVQSIYKDSQGHLYIGTFNDGLYHFNSEHQLIYHYLIRYEYPALFSNTIFSIFPENNGIIWLGTDKGLVRYNTNLQTFIRYTLNTKDLMPYLSLFDTMHWDKFIEKGNFFFCIYEDRHQNYWIGTYAGVLAKFDRQTESFKTFRSEGHDKYAIDAITALAEDQFGMLWIGTASDGIYIFNPVNNKYLRYHRYSNSPDSLASNLILSIFKDSQNRMWIGHRSTGLSVYDHNLGKFETYQDTDGLLNNTVTDITEDDHGHLWISTLSGLSCFDYETKSFSNYTCADGVNYNSPDRFPRDAYQINNYRGKLVTAFNRPLGYKACIHKDSDGNFYVGGNNGYIVFNPRDFIAEQSYQSNLIVTNFEILHENQTEYRPYYKIKELKLSYKDYIFSFDYSLLNFISPSENTYSHILAGFEKVWSDPSTARTVTYWNIPAGHYILKIKGRSKYGTWSQNPLAIDITITPPYWQTLWFRIATLLTIAGIIGLIIHQRFQRIKKQKIKLEEQVKERTVELHQSNEQLIEEIKFRKKAEAELRKSEEEYRDLFENAYDVIWITDMNGSLQAINNYFMNMLGYTKDQIIGQSILKFIANEYRFRSLWNYIKLKRDHQVECEIDIITKSGVKRIIWLKVRSIFDNGEMIGIHGIGRDTTELKKAQAELQEAEKAKRDSLKQLTLKLAHEIKNPLTSITSSAQLVASAKNTRDDPKIQRHMGIINKNVNICNHVIRELYAFTSRPVLQMAEIDIADLVAGLVSYASEKTEQYSDIQIKSSVASDVHTIIADKFRLEQALKNLINNAFEAISGSGIVEINAHPDAELKNIKIEISDSGHGITPEEMQNIFKPFQTTKAAGFGLGLSVVKDIIDAHKGSIEVHSQPNKGTTFTTILKLSESD